MLAQALWQPVGIVLAQPAFGHDFVGREEEIECKEVPVLRMMDLIGRITDLELRMGVRELSAQLPLSCPVVSEHTVDEREVQEFMENRELLMRRRQSQQAFAEDQALRGWRQFGNQPRDAIRRKFRGTELRLKALHWQWIDRDGAALPELLSLGHESVQSVLDLNLDFHRYL
jgi:hypothetical protein